MPIKRVMQLPSFVSNMKRPVQVKDLNDYVKKYDQYPDDIRSCGSNDIVYESLCETIVEVNPNYDVNSIGERFDGESEEDARKFILSEFNAVVDDDLWEQNIINTAHVNTWVESVLESFYENGFL